MAVHIRKHDMSLALNLTQGNLSPLGLFTGKLYFTCLTFRILVADFFALITSAGNYQPAHPCRWRYGIRMFMINKRNLIISDNISHVYWIVIVRKPVKYLIMTNHVHRINCHCVWYISDQTPTPTKFLRNCEELGLFQELSKNPFDDSFKKAMDEPIDHVNVENVSLLISF